MLKLILFVVALLCLTPRPIFADEYFFERIVIGKWGSGEGELGLGKNNALGFEGFDDAVPPQDSVVDSVGSIYVVDQVNSCIQVFDARGKVVFVFTDEKNRDWLSHVHSIAVLMWIPTIFCPLMPITGPNCSAI